MTNAPIFSIITITLNSEKYLSETIESVLQQDYPRKELLVIDGGSKDGTIDIIKSYGSSVKCISEPDNGISDAMNKGISLSTGDVIVHLHSDDRFKPGTLSKVSKMFQANPDMKWICGNGEFIDSNGRTIKEIRFKKYSYKKLKSHNFIVHPSVFIKREIFDKVGLFSTSLNYAMDYDMWLRIGKYYEPFQTKETLSSFRLHDASLSTFEFLKALDEEHQVRLANYEREAAAEKLYNLLRYRLVRFLKPFKYFRAY